MDGNKHVCSFQHNDPRKINENSLAFAFAYMPEKLGNPSGCGMSTPVRWVQFNTIFQCENVTNVKLCPRHESKYKQ
jgi:hypothetical protein